MTKVIKRNGKLMDFNKEKISIAIMKAMKASLNDVKVDKNKAIRISQRIENKVHNVDMVTIRDIEDLVHLYLIEEDLPFVAKSYEGYRAIREQARKSNTTDNSIFGLIDLTNEEVTKENSNKDARLASTQRDLIAGIVSKDLAARKLLSPEIMQYHNEGSIHFHDLDYLMQQIFNCCLVDLKDMLDNGTVINEKMIETPNSFQVACTVTTQIIAQIASGQYGGQSINGIDRILSPYVRKSYNKYLKATIEEQTKHYGTINLKVAEEIALERTKIEITSGVQTMQYQINTLQTSNGQSPFCTFMLNFDPEDEYAFEASLITEEILRQRIKGIKNEDGVYVTPEFPKLIYVTDEHNIHEDSKYYYLTELAAECTSKRMYPDYISAKKMRETYKGNVFAPMGCRALLAASYKNLDGTYKFDGRFNLGVVTLNLPQIALIAKTEEEFWKLLDERLVIQKNALMERVNLLKGTTSDISPIHWQHGGLARLEKGQTIDHLFYDGYATLTAGYIGLFETVMALTGESHTKHKDLALKILRVMKDATERWTKEENIQFALYGTPSENTAGRLCLIDKEKFGDIENVTDKEYYINSYHVDVREEINAFDKLDFESEFQLISTGGSISYIEIPNLQKNNQAVIDVIKYMYNHIIYAEFNTKLDYCYDCGYTGAMEIDDDIEWFCPNCENRDKDRMTIVRRTCGYLGSGNWSKSRTKDIKDRVLHL